MAQLSAGRPPSAPGCLAGPHASAASILIRASELVVEDHSECREAVADGPKVAVKSLTALTLRGRVGRGRRTDDQLSPAHDPGILDRILVLSYIEFGNLFS